MQVCLICSERLERPLARAATADAWYACTNGEEEGTVRGTHRILLVVFTIGMQFALARAESVPSHMRVFESTFESQKTYADPFNDVDVDVIFTQGSETWRVPTFWRGGSKWTVRFAPPAPGEYDYHLESTDRNNPDLNGKAGHVRITAYTGKSDLLRRGMLRVSANKRYFEHADGTPFYWLGDTWWMGMSDRLSWDGFQKLTADRKAKGFTVVQICAGLVPSNEELAPVDPGFRDEGGAVWDPDFKQINPKYFDYADRRIQELVDANIAPAIVGAWRQAIGQMGVEKMQKHWRYIIARYGAYPVFWIVGGEVYDPPDSMASDAPVQLKTPGWTAVARYLRATDPYHHPVTVHEIPPPYDTAFQDESLTDFDLFQPSHLEWPSVGIEIALLNTHRSRTSVTKPEVVGEIGYEMLGATHYEGFQRAAFWLGMLNGAAGHTYGANPVFEAYSTDKQFPRTKYTFLTWEEGMGLPGSYQLGLGAKLLQQYPWWRFEPHPEWVAPRGTTLLEPHKEVTDFNLGTFAAFFTDEFPKPSGLDYPGGEWKEKGGNFFLPYAAGIPGEVRFVYSPCFALSCHTPPTVLGLEPGIRYHTYYWEPSLGIKIDLGTVEHPAVGALIRNDKFEGNDSSNWTEAGTKGQRSDGKLSVSGASVAVVNAVNEADLVAAVDGHSNSNAGLIFRYHDAANYVAAVYSPKDKAEYIVERRDGVDGPHQAITEVPEIDSHFRLSGEVRGEWAVISIGDGRHTYTSRIISIHNTTAGGAGLRHDDDGGAQSFANFELRKSPTFTPDDHLETKLYDAKGSYRGQLGSPGWEFQKNKIILLDAYRPERLPIPQDWVLVLENQKR